MKLLAIDTATETCSVALIWNGQILSRELTEPRAHGRLVLPWVAELLAEAGLSYAELDALAVDRGPGGFTSLRIGLSVTQGLALAHDLPVHPVSSLAALAWTGRPEAFTGSLLAAFDARMGEVYAGWFSFGNDALEPLHAETLCSPEWLAQSDRDVQAAAGNAFEVYREVLGPRYEAIDGPINIHAVPTATAVAELAHRVTAVEATKLEPVYLRDQVAEKPKHV